MSDDLKSAYELAIEKLNRKDKESPPDSTAAKKLTLRQKEKIGEIRREIEAKLAEREILFKSEKRAARGDMEKIAKVEDAYRRDREHLLSRQEERVKEVKSGKSAG